MHPMMYRQASAGFVISFFIFAGIQICKWCSHSNQIHVRDGLDKICKGVDFIDLAAGFPDYLPPDAIRQALVHATESKMLHQYTRGFGHPRLVNALAKIYSPILNKKINPVEEILITGGAHESLYCAIRGFIDIDDEPNGSKSEFSSSQWILDIDKLENLITSKTKLLILNNPHNPLGKVFTLDELIALSKICIKNNLIVLSDEVYEWITHPPHKHIKIATLPGMWERTLTIGSAGKTFNVTGWRIGWTVGPKSLLSYAKTSNQFSSYIQPTLLQEAVAVMIENEAKILGTKDSFFTKFKQELNKNLVLISKELLELGFIVHFPQGGYFITVNISKFIEKDVGFHFSEKDGSKGFQFLKWMVNNLGILTVPISNFYSKPNRHLGEHFMRFCFTKKPETIEKAADRLNQWRQKKLPYK